MSLECWNTGSVPSWHSGLRIQGCHSCCIVCVETVALSDLIPDHAHGAKTEKNKKGKSDDLIVSHEEGDCNFNYNLSMGIEILVFFFFF